MLNTEEYHKIIKLKRLEKLYEALYKDVQKILENKFPDAVNFDDGDSIGNIILKKDIPQIAQKNNEVYVTYTPHGEDWGSGTVYIPLNENEYLEIYYST